MIECFLFQGNSHEVSDRLEVFFSIRFIYTHILWIKNIRDFLSDMFNAFAVFPQHALVFTQLNVYYSSDVIQRHFVGLQGKELA